MGFYRLPRFKRAATIPAIKVTNRDRQIIRLVHQHRFLRSSHIITLLGETSRHVLRRLRLLYHHGFLERPRAQVEYYGRGGSRHIVYGLGNKGAAILNQELGNAPGKIRWNEKNRAVHRIFFEHALLVSDVMVALELRCRKMNRVHLTASDALSPNDSGLRPFKWHVRLNGHTKLGVVPDRVFALDTLDEAGNNKRAFYFLEIDRGTMPVVRKNLTQSSFYRKLLAYEATWSQAIHRTHFGFNRFRVLTVITSADRVKSLIGACSQLKRGHGLFLFVDQATLEKHGDILTVLWQAGRPGETATLLSERR